MTNETEGLALPAAPAEGAEIGFEFYDHFEEPAETAWWFRLWTRNPEADGRGFRFFGTTAAGDHAAFWLVHPDTPIHAQPVVFIGSEGDRGVIARDLGDLLWLFASGLGPAEAFLDPEAPAEPSGVFREIAERHAPGRRRPPAELVAAARAAHPRFPAYIDSLCR